MKNILLCIVFALMVISGCKKKESDLAILRAHTWQFTDYRKTDGTVITAEPGSPDSVIRHMTIQFIGEDSIIGQSCVNDFTGNYGSIESKHSLLIVVREQSEVLSNYSYCNDFISNLGEAESFSVNDNELLLNYGLMRSIHFIKSN